MVLDALDASRRGLSLGHAVMRVQQGVLLTTKDGIKLTAARQRIDFTALKKSITVLAMLDITHTAKPAVLEAVHETATGLHQASVMDQATLREFDRLCLPAIEPLAPLQIKQIRETSRVSQAVFAALLMSKNEYSATFERIVADGLSLKCSHLRGQGH